MELSGQAGLAGWGRQMARSSRFLARRFRRAEPGPLQRVLAGTFLVQQLFCNISGELIFQGATRNLT